MLNKGITTYYDPAKIPLKGLTSEIKLLTETKNLKSVKYSRGKSCKIRDVLIKNAIEKPKKTVKKYFIPCHKQ